MNALKFQQALLDECLKGPGGAKSAAYLERGSGHVMLFLHGNVAQFQPRDRIFLDLAKLTAVPGFASTVDRALSSKVEANLLTPTDEYRLYAGNRKLRIYQGRNWRTGIDQSLLRFFDLPFVKLYQLEDRGVVLVTEKCTVHEEVVGLVMPCDIRK